MTALPHPIAGGAVSLVPGGQAVGESHSDSHAVSQREAASDGGWPWKGKLRVRGGDRPPEDLELKPHS